MPSPPHTPSAVHRSAACASSEASRPGGHSTISASGSAFLISEAVAVAVPDSWLATTTEAPALGQGGRVGRRPAGRGQLVPRRYHPPQGERRPHAQGRTGQHIARVVHPGVDAGRRDGQRDRCDDRTPALRLQRHPGGERGGRRGVPRGERRGHRLPLQLPYHRHGVQDRPLPADRPLAHRVDRGRRHRERGDAPQRGPPGPRTAPEGGHTGRGPHPQQPVVGGAAQPGQHRTGGRPVPLGQVLEDGGIAPVEPVTQSREPGREGSIAR